MLRRGLTLLGLATLAAVAMTAIVATAPNSYPTPTDSLWGHVMPHTQLRIALALLVASAALAGLATFARLSSRRLAAAISVALGSGVVLFGVCILAWRLHSPFGAGNGG